MLPFCQTNMPMPFGHTTVGYSVTFPTYPFKTADITGFPLEQNSLHASAGITSEGTCQNCRLAKRESLNRQVCELLEGHSPVEIDGKEILGWYMLLAAEDRKFIKEYGSIAEFLSDNPSLLIINNWVMLKSECSLDTLDESQRNYCSIMDITETIRNKSSPQDSEDYSNRYTDGYTAKELVTDVSSLRKPFWFDQVNTSKEEFLYCGITTNTDEHEAQQSSRLEKWETSIGAHEVNSGRKDTEELSLPSVPPVRVNPRDAVAFTDIICRESSYPELTGFGQINTSSKQIKSTKCESFDDSGITEGETVCPMRCKECIWDSLENNGDQECSASDIVDDETFLSVRSGSIYSRSSSQFSLDTDVEQCIFEEALEDLSSLSLYSQVNRSHGVLCSTDDGPQAATTNQSSVVKNVLQATNAKSNIERKCNLRNVSCNTDLSWVSNSCNDKLTQTMKTITQETGVNTDIIINELFSQTEKIIQIGTGACKETEHSKENNNKLSSDCKEAFLQRAIKAELQLVDVQRWLCLQLCWKTQQQIMEKQSFFGLNKSPTDLSTGDVGFSLLSALAEVEEKYQEMKKQIQAGVPLETLIPLNMQLTKVETPANDLLKECFTDASQQRTMQTGSGPQEDVQKTNSVEKDSTSTAIPDTQDGQQQGKETGQFGNLSHLPHCYYIHVGNIAPTVQEVELMNAFKKYNVSNIFLEKSSVTSSYAVLIFTSLEQAQTAVKEMNGKEFCGKKLKVRSIRNTNYDFSLVFSAPLPHTNEPKGCFVPQPQSSSKPKPVPPGATPKVQSDASGKGLFMSMPKNNTFFPYNNANQAFPAEPYSSMSSFKTCMPPGNQWMLQSLQSNLVSYSSISNPLFIPYSYPQCKSPSCSPYPVQAPMTNSSPYIPFINKQAYAPTYVGKESSSYKAAKPVNPVYATNRQSSCGVTEPIQNKNTSARKLISGSNTSAGNVVDKPTSAQSVSGPSLESTNIWKPEETVSVPSTPTALYKAATTVTDSSTPSLLSTAPLRVPTFVPDNVTIPKASKTSSDAMSSAGVLPYSTNKEQASSSDSSQQGDSITDWGVHPQLTSSEYGGTVIPNKLNFCQFKRVVNFLRDRHKDVTSEQIFETLQNMRIKRGGCLSGMTIPEIISEASATLAAIENH